MSPLNDKVRSWLSALTKQPLASGESQPYPVRKRPLRPRCELLTVGRYAEHCDEARG
jgi:hypothetical protein